MTIRAEYQVQKLPESYVTEEVTFSYVSDKDDPKVKVRTETLTKHVGGFLVTMPNGNSIRLMNADQFKNLKIRPSPRLIDTTTGEEVNEHGIPLDIAHLVRNNSIIDGEMAAPVSNQGADDGPDTYESILAANGKDDD